MYMSLTLVIVIQLDVRVLNISNWGPWISVSDPGFFLRIRIRPKKIITDPDPDPGT